MSRIIIFYLLFVLSNNVYARTVNTGIIVDGTSKRELLPLAQIKQEIITLNQGEFSIYFPDDKVIDAGWQLDEIYAAISTMNQDNTIDLIYYPRVAFVSRSSTL